MDSSGLSSSAAVSLSNLLFPFLLNDDNKRWLHTKYSHYALGATIYEFCVKKCHVLLLFVKSTEFDLLLTRGISCIPFLD